MGPVSGSFCLTTSVSESEIAGRTRQSARRRIRYSMVMGLERRLPAGAFQVDNQGVGLASGIIRV